MQKSGFFNALMNNGQPDRKYNANDYCDNLAVVISNGVLRSENDDLRVTASGMVVSVGVGRAWINGHYYYNDTPLSFAAVTAPTGGARYDRVVLRLNKEVSARSVTLVYVKGTAAEKPTKPAPVRTNNIFDLVLADIYVGTNATSVTVTDTRSDADICGWVYSVKGDGSFFTTLDNQARENMQKMNAEWAGMKENWASVTLFKRYKFETVTDSTTDRVQFNIPQYDADTCFIEVCVNGMLVTLDTDYSINGNYIVFKGSLNVGAEVVVYAYKSIDGTGIMTVADEITALQNQVAVLANTNDYVYICNGYDDNVKLSQLAEAWFNVQENAGKIIRVYGKFGATAPYAGAGTTTSPYHWFNIGNPAPFQTRRITFDFTGCSEIILPITAGTFNYIFFGADAHIVGANVTASQTGTDTVIRVFSADAGDVTAENCRFNIDGYKDSRIGQTGVFTNCFAEIANITNGSYCFLPFPKSLLCINGGEYYAYTGSSALQSAIIGQSSANCVSILNGVNAPKVERAGYYQTHALLQWTGGGQLRCRDLITTLPNIVVAGISDVSGTIAINKTGIMK